MMEIFFFFPAGTMMDTFVLFPAPQELRSPEGRGFRVVAQLCCKRFVALRAVMLLVEILRLTKGCLSQ
jgi:hypothetical protein